jgi:hypothetical protein
MRVARALHGSVKYFSDVLVFSGNLENSEHTVSAESFNVKEDEWTDLPDMPESSSAVVATTTNKIIYITG